MSPHFKDVLLYGVTPHFMTSIGHDPKSSKKCVTFYLIFCFSNLKNNFFDLCLMWEPVKKKVFFFLKGGCLLEPEIPQNPSNFF